MYYFTVEGLEKLKNDFEQLRLDYIERIKDNNADRESNINESGSFLNTRTELCNRYNYEKKEREEKLNNAIIIEKTDEYKNWDGKTIIRKCEVLLNFMGEEVSYKILGCNEGNPEENIISCDADLALALLGHKVDDIIPFRGSKIVILDIKPIKKVVKKKVLENK